MKSFKYILLIVTGLYACQDQKAPEEKAQANIPVTMKDYHWFLGTWYAHGLDFFEEWTIGNDSLLLGRAFNVEGQDTTVNERISFNYAKGKFEYVPVVRRQNDGRPVVFSAVNSQPNMIQFENMQHDFPNRIIYFKHSDKQIDVRIEEVNGTEIGKTYDIIMTKVE